MIELQNVQVCDARKPNSNNTDRSIKIIITEMKAFSLKQKIFSQSTQALRKNLYKSQSVLYNTSQIKSYMKKVLLFFASAGLLTIAFAQDIKNNPNSNHANKFEQLGTILPTPNEYRTASGAPGAKYWQQRCDYNIKATLDEKTLKIT